MGVRQQIFVNLVEVNKKWQNLLNFKLKQKLIKFTKFVAVFNPGHKCRVFMAAMLVANWIYS